MKLPADVLALYRELGMQCGHVVESRPKIRVLPRRKTPSKNDQYKRAWRQRNREKGLTIEGKPRIDTRAESGSLKKLLTRLREGEIKCIPFSSRLEREKIRMVGRRLNFKVTAVGNELIKAK